MWILFWFFFVNIMKLQHHLWKRLSLFHYVFFAPLSKVSSVHFSHSVMSDSASPWTEACQASLYITNSLLKLMSTVSVMPSNNLILCRPLLLLPSIFPSIWVFSNELILCIRWPKYWSFSFGITSSNEYSRLSSFRMDWLDLLAVQGTLKSLPQHHSSKASILWHSAFFIVQLSYPYMTTGKTIALTRQIFVGKIMSLLFNMLSRLLIAFLPKSKHLLISWLQSPSVFGAQKQNKVSHYFHCFPIYLPRNDGTRCHDVKDQLTIFICVISGLSIMFLHESERGE